MKKNVHVDDFTRPGGQVTELDPAELMPLPPPYDKMEKPPIRKLTEDQCKRMDATLDGVVALCGFAFNRSGEVLAFSILANDTQGNWQARAIADNICKALVDEKAE